METEIRKKTPGRRNIIIILLISCSVFLIYYAVMSMMGPGNKLTEIKNESEARTGNNINNESSILNDSLYISLIKKRSFLQSRIAMAATDSIYLTINLADSTANIEISGVNVHNARISNIKGSRILMKGHENIILSLLASPLTIINDYSTIKKEPVMIKMAPKDTSEFKPDIMPDTSLTEPVKYILEMTNGIIIYVNQEEKEETGDRMNLFIFDLSHRFRNVWYTLKSIIRFRVPEYHPFIKISLPRADAKIIYRAIPKNGQVGINL